MAEHVNVRYTKNGKVISVRSGGSTHQKALAKTGNWQMADDPWDSSVLRTSQAVPPNQRTSTPVQKKIPAGRAAARAEEIEVPPFKSVLEPNRSGKTFPTLEEAKARMADGGKIADSEPDQPTPAEPAQPEPVKSEKQNRKKGGQNAKG